MPDKKLVGKRAIVTGASSGMGATMTRHIAAAGANVWAVGGGNTEALQETIASCAASGVKAGGTGYDFNDARQAGVAVKEGAEFLGGLDILVNCAGVRNFKSLIDIDDEDIDFMFELNIKALFHSSREAARIMVPQKSGQILMIGSVSGERARPNRTLYCATKAAVNSLTKSMALELSPLGIRVNCLAPGLIDSGRVKTMLGEDLSQRKNRVKDIPLGRLGDPEDIGATVVFLLSPENGFMTGSVVSTDGGAVAG
jgi:3-oxoacyl-[acyl-carrier protein] reductase